jgi:Spy/CpxP family protein refolding chaperone
MNESSAKRRAVLWVTVVFVLGAALGGLFGYFYGHRNTVAAANPPLSEAQRRAQRVEQLTQELGLTKDQKQQLDSALSQLHAEYKSLREQSNQQLNSEMDQARQKGRDQIRALLTPEQKPKFEEFLKRLDEERKRNAAPPPR